MRIRIIGVGKNEISYFLEGEADYLHRLKHYCRIEIDWVQSEKIHKNRLCDEIRDIEGNRLSKKISNHCTAVALDSSGTQLSSKDLTNKIAFWQINSVKEIVFIIGGPLGLSQEVLQSVDLVLSLSRMTFPHEMVRLILLEQLYRSFTILKREKYHK